MKVYQEKLEEGLYKKLKFEKEDLAKYKPQLAKYFKIQEEQLTAEHISKFIRKIQEIQKQEQENEDYNTDEEEKELNEALEISQEDEVMRWRPRVIRPNGIFRIGRLQTMITGGLDNPQGTYLSAGNYQAGAQVVLLDGQNFALQDNGGPNIAVTQMNQNMNTWRNTGDSLNTHIIIYK